MLNVEFLKSGKQFTPYTKNPVSIVRKSKYQKLEDFYNKGIRNQ